MRGFGANLWPDWHRNRRRHQFAFMIWAVSSGAASLDPDLELAAQSCGAGPVKRFHVTLPAVTQCHYRPRC
jgi:hypothetical protein